MVSVRGPRSMPINDDNGTRKNNKSTRLLFCYTHAARDVAHRTGGNHHIQSEGIVIDFPVRSRLDLLDDPQVGPHEVHHLHQGPADVVGIDAAHQYVVIVWLFMFLFLFMLLLGGHDGLDGPVHVVPTSVEGDDLDPVAVSRRHLLPLKVRDLSLRVVHDDSQVGAVEVPDGPDGRRSGVPRGSGRQHDLLVRLLLLVLSVVIVGGGGRLRPAGKVLQEKDRRSHSEILLAGNKPTNARKQKEQANQLG